MALWEREISEEEGEQRLSAIINFAGCENSWMLVMTASIVTLTLVYVAGSSVYYVTALRGSKFQEKKASCGLNLLLPFVEVYRVVLAVLELLLTVIGLPQQLLGMVEWERAGLFQMLLTSAEKT